jgi:hypothetical protein
MLEEQKKNAGFSEVVGGDVPYALVYGEASFY